MEPAPVPLDVLASKHRRLEARVAMLEDAVQVYGPPPRKVAIPELTREQKVTMAYVMACLFLTVVSVIASNRKVEA